MGSIHHVRVVLTHDDVKVLWFSRVLAILDGFGHRIVPSRMVLIGALLSLDIL